MSHIKRNWFLTVVVSGGHLWVFANNELSWAHLFISVLFNSNSNKTTPLKVEIAHDIEHGLDFNTYHHIYCWREHCSSRTQTIHLQKNRNSNKVEMLGIDGTPTVETPIVNVSSTPLIFDINPRSVTYQRISLFNFADLTLFSHKCLKFDYGVC